MRSLLTGSTDPGLTPRGPLAPTGLDRRRRGHRTVVDPTLPPNRRRRRAAQPAAPDADPGAGRRAGLQSGRPGGARHRLPGRAADDARGRPRPHPPGGHRVHQPWSPRSRSTVGSARRCRGSRRARPPGRATRPAVSLPAKTLSEAKATKLLVQAGQAGRRADLLRHPGRQSLPRRRADHQHRPGRQPAEAPARELSPAGSGHHPAGAAHLHRVRLVDPDGRRRPDRSPRRPLHAAGLEGPVVRRARPRTSSKRCEPTSRVRRKGSLDGVAARWWLDARTGLLLGQETYDGRGNVVVTSRLADLRFGTAGDQSPVVAEPARPRTTATLTLSRAAQLRRDGWVCADRLAGLPLLRLRTDQTDDPDARAPRLQRRADHPERGRAARPAVAGRRPAAPATRRWVPGSPSGMPTTATWTSGDVVLTAVTDGSRETLAAAVAALPA